jgi:hypothetical protein
MYFVARTCGNASVVRNHSSMRLFLLIFTFQTFSSLQAQETSFNISGQDTIELNRLYFKKTVALRLDEAIVLLDYQPFLKKLQDEKTWLRKEIRARERMIKKSKDYPGITSSQLKSLQERLSGCDSIYKTLYFQKLDTAWIDYSLIEKAHSSVSDLVSSSLETKRCMVLSSDCEIQTYVIKQTGSKKTGETTGVGLSYYFIKGAKRHFWTKMNWIS